MSAGRNSWSETPEHQCLTRGWLQALRCAHGYETVVFKTSPPTGRLSNGLLFCRVNKLNGCGLVSLPFSDQQEPLCDSSDQLDFVVRDLRQHGPCSFKAAS
jgi:hypothetical protein